MSLRVLFLAPLCLDEVALGNWPWVRLRFSGMNADINSHATLVHRDVQFATMMVYECAVHGTFVGCTGISWTLSLSVSAALSWMEFHATSIVPPDLEWY